MQNPSLERLNQAEAKLPIYTDTTVALGTADPEMLFDAVGRACCN